MGRSDDRLGFGDLFHGRRLPLACSMNPADWRQHLRRGNDNRQACWLQYRLCGPKGLDRSTKNLPTPANHPRAADCAIRSPSRTGHLPPRIDHIVKGLDNPICACCAANLGKVEIPASAPAHSFAAHFRSGRQSNGHTELSLAPKNLQLMIHGAGFAKFADSASKV